MEWTPEEEEAVNEYLKMLEEEHNQFWDKWSQRQKDIEDQIFEIVKDLEYWELQDIIFGVRAKVKNYRS